MKINELLTESLSRIAYHYTNLNSASKIMASGEFQLSSDLGSIEQHYSPRGYRYFLSTTRTLTGGYHSSISYGAVMFVLDGNWFNQHYKSKAVDYWENRDPAKIHHRSHEAEDRVFSKTPTIPIDGVSAIHVLIQPDGTNEHLGAWARTVFINAKRRGIPAYLYNDEAAWRRLDTDKSQPISKNPILRGQQHVTKRQSMYNRKGYLHPWVQLITATDKNQLGKDADKLRNSLRYYPYEVQNAAQGLGTEMSNARKPSAGIDRENAVKIIEFMKKNNINDLGELVELLTTKWKSLSDKEEKVNTQS